MRCCGRSLRIPNLPFLWVYGSFLWVNGSFFWVVSFLWADVPFLRVYVGFMYGFRAHCRLLKSRLNEMIWRIETQR